MIDYTQEIQRASLPRLILFWTVLLAALLTAGSDFVLPDSLGRFVYWAAHIGCGLTAVTLVTRWLQQRWLSGFSQWIQLAISSVTAVVVFAPIGLVLDVVLPASFGPDGHGDLLDDAASGGVFSEVLDEVLSAAPTVIAVWLIVHLTYRFMNRLAAPLKEGSATQTIEQNQTVIEPVNESKDEPVAADGFLSRLSPALGTDVMVIRSDANYVHVHTTEGRTMFLYSLNKAADELGERGLLVHRSFWVAIDHVREVRKQGAQTVCVLTDNTIVPVSRRRQKDVVDIFGKDFARSGSVSVSASEPPS